MPHRPVEDRLECLGGPPVNPRHLPVLDNRRYSPRLERPGFGILAARARPPTVARNRSLEFLPRTTGRAAGMLACVWFACEAQ